MYFLFEKSSYYGGVAVRVHLLYSAVLLYTNRPTPYTYQIAKDTMTDSGSW